MLCVTPWVKWKWFWLKVRGSHLTKHKSEEPYSGSAQGGMLWSIQPVATSLYVLWLMAVILIYAGVMESHRWNGRLYFWEAGGSRTPALQFHQGVFLVPVKKKKRPSSYILESGILPFFLSLISYYSWFILCLLMSYDLRNDWRNQRRGQQFHVGHFMVSRCHTQTCCSCLARVHLSAVADRDHKNKLCSKQGHRDHRGQRTRHRAHGAYSS